MALSVMGVVLQIMGSFNNLIGKEVYEAINSGACKC
jgi:hypothetical protein